MQKAPAVVRPASQHSLVVRLCARKSQVLFEFNIDDDDGDGSDDDAYTVRSETPTMMIMISHRACARSCCWLARRFVLVVVVRRLVAKRHYRLQWRLRV